MTETKPFSLATHGAEELRAEGARLVSSKQYEQAVEKYTEAILAFGRANFLPGVGVSFTNRAIVCAKLGWWPESYCDAKSATRAFPKFGKAWYRAGVALEKLGMLRAAGAAYYRAVEVDSSLYAVATPAIKRCRLASIDNRQKMLLICGPPPPPVSMESETRGEFREDDVRSELQNSISQIVIGLGPGRCGLHSLAALIEQSPEASARCLSLGSNSRYLLWTPSEPTRIVAARRLVEMAKLLTSVEKLKVVADINYAWLPYVRDLLALCPRLRFVVMRRDAESVVESWFNWTEAGSARLSSTNGFMPVHLHAKNHWQWHDQTLFEFDEWDLTLPKFPASELDKRAAIGKYVDEYYDECDKLSVEFPDNFITCECDELFQSQDKKQQLYEFIGLDASSAARHVFKINAQRYQYEDSQGTIDDFLVGDFEAGDDDDSCTDTDDDEMRRRTRRLALPASKDDDGENTTEGEFCQVVVPDHAMPGDTLRITKRGKAFDVKIPRDKRPGDAFRAALKDDDSL